MQIDENVFLSLSTVGAFLVGLSCGALSTWLFHIIRTEVNANLPPDDRVGPLGATPALFLRVHRLHRTMYPRSWLRVVVLIVMGVGFISTIVLAKLLGVV